jgi:hypothetical protein
MMLEIASGWFIIWPMTGLGMVVCIGAPGGRWT